MFITPIVKLTVIISLVLFTAILIYARLLNSFESTEQYTKHSSFVVGESQEVRVSNLIPKIPGIIIPFRKQVRLWTAGVPLTPFIAQLRQYPPLPTPLPKYILYNPDYLVPIQSQGQCGCCFAFAVCDMLADRIVLATSGILRQNLSVQQLVSCFDTTSCDGGSPEDVCLWLATSRTLLGNQKDLPYKQENDTVISTPCRSLPSRVQVGINPGDVYTIVSFIPETNPNSALLAQNIANMKQELIERGPFYCAMTVYANLYQFSGTSVYTGSGGSQQISGHAVEIIGFCEEGVDSRPEFKKAHWLVRNSWSDKWPTQSKTKGYFAIEMGRNVCGIESRCGMAIPQLYGSLPNTPPVSFEKLRLTVI